MSTFIISEIAITGAKCEITQSIALGVQKAFEYLQIELLAANVVSCEIKMRAKCKKRNKSALNKTSVDHSTFCKYKDQVAASKWLPFSPSLFLQN